MSKVARIRIINTALAAIAESTLTHGTTPATEQALAYWQSAMASTVNSN